MPISGKAEIGVCSAPFASLMLRCARDTDLEHYEQID
jgi:hypothetical protein